MGWLSILLFLIKYGPAIVELIISAIKLIRWLRDNDDTGEFHADDKKVKETLKGMADSAKQNKDLTNFKSYVDQLRLRKDEIEKKRAEV